MGRRHVTWLLPVVALASCGPFPAGQGPGLGAVQIDCRHFYRTPDGAWQGDGNATAIVNGRQWFVSINRYTAAGPLVGGVPIYNELQRQCGGVRPVAAVAPLPSATRSLPGRCLSDGSRTTLSGRISYRTVPPDEGDGLPGHHYARMVLDRPVCMLEGNFAGESDGRAVAIVPEGTRPAAIREGAHVTLTGVLRHKSTSNEPPETLQLDVTQ